MITPSSSPRRRCGTHSSSFCGPGTPEGREPDETEIQEALQLIDAAIVVEQTPKVSVEALTPCEAS